jgi:Na+/H+-dicarboxylate symporter
LVLIITAYNTVFNSTGTPAGFEYILAIDWFMDRFRTTLNVTGDAVCCVIVACLAPLEEFEEQEAEKQPVIEAEEEQPVIEQEAEEQPIVEEA